MGSHVVVVGGGIGGLSAALAPLRRGLRFTVLERVPELREIGAELTLMANAVRGLDVLGLGPAVRRSGHSETPGGIRISNGRWLSRVDGEAIIRSRGTMALGIHRATLHRLLREALSPAALHTGAEVVDVVTGILAVLIGRLMSRGRLQVRADLIGIRGFMAINLLVVVVGLAILSAFIFAASDVPWPGTFGALVAAIGIAVGGPLLMSYLRRPIGAER